MKLGINIWNFCDGYTDAEAGWIDHVARLGFTAVELPVSGPMVSQDILREKVKKNGLALAVCVVMMPGRNILSTDAAVRRETGEYFKACIRLLSQAGGSVLCGPLYAGEVPRPFGAKEHERVLRRAAEALIPIADYAAEHRITLALEPLHRYRTSIVNTAAHALRLCAFIDRANVGVHFDTYHANIEQADVAAALEEVLAQGKLAHFHACGNDRGVPGGGHLPWGKIWALLKKYNYNSMVNMETFARPGIEAVWHEAACTADETACAGLAYLQTIFNEQAGEPSGRA